MKRALLFLLTYSVLAILAPASLAFVARATPKVPFGRLMGATTQTYTPFVITPDSAPPTRGIIIVDGFSEYHSGYLIDKAIHDYNVGVVRVLSPYMAAGFQKEDAQEDHFQRTAPLDSPELEAWLQSIPFPIDAILCESDSGLDYAEQLACAMCQNGKKSQLKHNGYLEARRDKFQMNEVCRSKGIPTVQQALCSTTEEATEQAFGLGSVIIKPRRGVASDRVALCRTMQDIQVATSSILDSTVFGTYDIHHDTVLLQEYVDGTEYAVDVVSKNGVHKTAALWVYDKTSTSEDGTSNPFAYLSGKLVSADDPDHPRAHDIMDYVDACLTALEIQWGMSHSEVKINSKGDIRLIEVNVRQQNDHFGPICSICVGYNALDLCLSAYLEDDNDDNNLFDCVPSHPILQRSAMIVNLACFVNGQVSRINHLEEIQELESCVAMEVYPGFEVGSTVKRTKDIRSDCGWVHLVNESEECMMRDYNMVCRMMQSMFEIVAEERMESL